MADKPINNAPEEATAAYSLYGRKNNSTNNLVQYLINQFAHAIGLTASDRGRFFRVNSSGDVESVAAGTSSQYLGWDGSGDLVAKTPTAPAFVQISKQTVSSPVSAVTFTGIASSGYSAYRLIGINAVTAEAATTSSLLLQVSTDNGSTFKTTSGDYYDSTTARTYLTATACSGSTSSFQKGGFCIEIIGLGISDRATNAALLYSRTGISAANILNAGISNAAQRQTAEADNAFRIIVSAGSNITAGTFILYGLTET